MRIAVVHGYFLGDSGSAVYVRELSRQFARDGHEVTLVCQERAPETYDFIDTFFKLRPGNLEMDEIFSRSRPYSGACRLVRPDIRDNLLTYVASSDTRFRNTTFQEASVTLINEYLEDNITALKTVWQTWPQDFVQANHAIMQPYETAASLNGSAPFCATIHGSALNFSVKTDLRLVPYFTEGVKKAAAVVALSEDSARDVISYAAGLDLDISGKTEVISPGVDTDRFNPDAGTAPAEDRIMMVGRLLWTKGTHYAVAAVPLISQSGRDVKLTLAGDGPMRKPLEEFVGLLNEGRLADARQLIKEEPELKASAEHGPVIPDFGWEEEELYAKAAAGNMKNRIRFAGHLTHEQLAPLMAGSDISMMPSVFPEAYGLAAVEGLSAGAVPVASYHSGLKAPLDVVDAELKDPVLKSLIPGIPLTRALADCVVHVLDRYPTKDTVFRKKLHALAEKRFSWAKTSETYIMLFKE
ncbi:MAG: glycosyltransferase family 4 protein [Actinomycetota bacterium]